MDADVWDFRPELHVGPETGVTGFKVEASDGRIGKVAEAGYEPGAAYIVVDTGPWILGASFLLPAGTVNRVDRQAGVVGLDLTKNDVSTSPPYNPRTTPGDLAFLHQVQEHYRRTS